MFFFHKLDLSVFVDVKKFSPDTLGLNLEVLKLLHIFMGCHEVGFK